VHPLELLVLVGLVEDLEPGACRYHPGGHALEKTAGGDQRALLAGAAQGRSWVRYAAPEVVFATIYERTTRNYGERGIRYVHMEAGHASQNLFLQAQAWGLAAWWGGPSTTARWPRPWNLPKGMRPLSLMPVRRD
jgi:SagB-type dehydrogenase family enzyme